MTDTNPRDLIKRLAEELDTLLMAHHYGGVPPEIQHATTLVIEAYAFLDQPEPEGPTDEEIKNWHSRCADLTQLGEAEHYWAFDLSSDKVAGVVSAALACWGLPAAEPEGTITEPRGCPTPGACSCPAAPFVPPELIRALELAEAALADISDTEREPWSEARAAQDLPRIRAVLARWGRSPQ